MKISNELSDDAVLAEIGQRLANTRVEQGLTQARLAQEAGVSKRTVERIEAGASAQLSSLIRLLRTLGLLEGFEALVPELRASPIDLLERRGKERKRASGSRRSRSETDEEWRWGEDT